MALIRSMGVVLISCKKSEATWSSGSATSGRATRGRGRPWRLQRRLRGVLLGAGLPTLVCRRRACRHLVWIDTRRVRCLAPGRVVSWHRQLSEESPLPEPRPKCTKRQHPDPGCGLPLWIRSPLATSVSPADLERVPCRQAFNLKPFRMGDFTLGQKGGSASDDPAIDPVRLLDAPVQTFHLCHRPGRLRAAMTELVSVGASFPTAIAQMPSANLPLGGSQFTPRLV